MSRGVSVRTATVNLSIAGRTADANEGHIDGPGIASPPVEYVTENGFCIVRLPELRPAGDLVSECHFLVRDAHGEESESEVRFDESVIIQVQRQRHSPLSNVSLFWLTLAEQHLATYIWESDHSPVDGLIISHVSGTELALAAGWID